MSFCFGVEMGMLIFSLRVKFPHLKVIVGKHVIYVDQQPR